MQKESAKKQLFVLGLNLFLFVCVLLLFRFYQVHVKTLTGRLVTVLVHPYDTIQQLRSKVAMKEGISVDQIILLMNGLHLDDGTFLREWNIGNGTVLFMTFRLRGG